ncbi:E3 ubiquitin-protein ligase ATL31-like [Macadamia integrifolia]|uniref:E3 ubiquitin-protein ligase ATL31-like n=1 Tax=Macadamia integrifolia TaxID=60698 RepID=UPI001C4FE0A3|nr:E3 ubiquitin-protein ligase ATL31-like [Macadamia integrifolia]
MKNEWKQSQSHSSILHLIGRNPEAQNGLICIYLLLIFQSLPYAAAHNRTHDSAPSDSSGFSNALSPSTALVIVVIIMFFFLLGFFSVYIDRCCGPRSGGTIRFIGVEGGISGRNKGLNLAVIDTLPTFAYSYVKDHKLGKGALECAVCLSEFEDEDTLRLLPKCDHVFHPECIDEWFSKRTTCPVCRANLVPVSGEIPAITAPVQDIEGDSHGGIPASETGEAGNQQISINVTSEEPELLSVGVAVAVTPEVINQAPMQNRPARSTKPRYAGRFPRSHSTGHSLVHPGEDVERFTLRLPVDVRKQILNMRHLNRTRSMVGYRTTGEGSSRGGKLMRGWGYRTTGEGSSRGGKSTMGAIGEKPEGWVFSMRRPFLMRASSSRPPKMTAEGNAPVTRSPLRVSTKHDGTVPSSSLPPA